MIKDIRSSGLKPTELKALLSAGKTIIQEDRLEWFEEAGTRIYLPSQENTLKYNPTTNQLLHPIIPKQMLTDSAYGVEPLLRSIKDDSTAGDRRYLVPFSEQREGFSIGHFRTLIVERKEQDGQYRFEFQIVDSKSNWMSTTVFGRIFRFIVRLFGYRYLNSDKAFEGILNDVFSEDKRAEVTLHPTQYLGVQSAIRDNRCGAFTLKLIQKVAEEHPVEQTISEILAQIEPSTLLPNSELKSMQQDLSAIRTPVHPARSDELESAFTYDPDDDPVSNDGPSSKADRFKPQ